MFDRIDATTGGEVHGVKKEACWNVVDPCCLCDLCDLCYVVKCPDVPPHPCQLDFPHLMRRAKAIKFKAGWVSSAGQLLGTSTCSSRTGARSATRARRGCASR